RGRAEPADRRDRVEEADAPRDDFRQHGLEDHVVLAADQPQLHHALAQLARQELLEGERGVHAAEAAAQDQDASRLRRLHVEHQRSLSLSRSPTRSALAMIVNAGFTAALDGKNDASTT